MSIPQPISLSASGQPSAQSPPAAQLSFPSCGCGSEEREQRVPLWLREISSNEQGLPPPTHPIFTDDGVTPKYAYVTVSVVDGSVTKHTRFPSAPFITPANAHPCPRRVAVLRDGPIVSPSTGVAASLHGMTSALISTARCEVVLIHCLRGAHNPKDVVSPDCSDFSRVRSPNFPFTEVICIRPDHFYEESIGAIVAHANIAVCHFDSVEAVNWQSFFIREACGDRGVRLVLDLFDVESTLGRWKGHRDEIERLERSAVGHVDAILTRSATDREALIALCQRPSADSDTDSNTAEEGVLSKSAKAATVVATAEIEKKMYPYRGGSMPPSLSHTDATDGSHSPRPYDLVYLGNMLYPPNATALLTLVGQLAVVEGSTTPEPVSILVVGNADDSLKQKCLVDLASPLVNVKFHGFAESLSRVLRSARFGVAPLFSHDGSGTSVKTIDYGLHGLPIIATPFAFRGLDYELHMPSSPSSLPPAVFLPEERCEEWASIVRNALSDASYPQHAAAAAKVQPLYVELRSWENTIGDVALAYGIEMPRYSSLPSFRVTFEGMPRCGKTTSLNRMKRLEPRTVGCCGTDVDGRHNESKKRTHGILFFDEMQPTAEVAERILTGSPVGNLELSKWFLDRECERKIEGDGVRFVVSDRSFLCTLAYCFASSKMAACSPVDTEEGAHHTASAYDALRRYFFSKRDQFPIYDKVIIFDNPPCVTIGRRGAEERGLVTNASWVNERFMEHFRYFFTGPLISEFIDAEKTSVHFIPASGDCQDVVFHRVLQFLQA